MNTMLYFVITIAVATAVVPFWTKCAHHVGLTAKNYQAQAIPQSMGVIFVLTYFAAAAWALRADLIASSLIWRTLVITMGLGFLGFVDDVWGSQQVKGLKGHFSILLKGKITTGLLKAAGGYLICFLAVKGLPDSSLLQAVWQAAMVALTANLINLFDLRPGRALKLFFLLSILYLAYVKREDPILMLFPFLLTALVFLPWDLAGEGMMGDAGSNILGGVLGLAVAVSSPFWLQFCFFCFLCTVHVLAEKFSLTKVIARNRVLCFLDNLGRLQNSTLQED